MSSKELEETINYFKSFEEGDNITITCDFIMNIEYLISLVERNGSELK